MKNNYNLECCVDSLASARAALRGGADRLELCANLIIGGTTPSMALYEKIREQTDTDIRVLIRPRFGDFLYSEEEACIMCREIEAFRKGGADGIVIGSLCADGSLHIEQMKRFMEQAGSMPVTLHRAFDVCRDSLTALMQAKKLGIRTILTSGRASSCLKGISLLKELQALSDNQITILAGGGVDADAVKTLLSQTALTDFHMSGKKERTSGMQYRNPSVSMGLPGMDEYTLWQTDEESIRSVRTLLDKAAAGNL